MSTHVKLLRDKSDPTYQKNLKVFLACQEAGIDPPPTIDEYFSDGDPESPLELDFKPREWYGYSEQGFEIDLNELPPGVKTIRFYNSW